MRFVARIATFYGLMRVLFCNCNVFKNDSISFCSPSQLKYFETTWNLDFRSSVQTKSPYRSVTCHSLFMASTSNSVSEVIPLNDEEHCIICLQDIIDRTILPECGHKYTCFQCICAWITSGTETMKARRCPLCNTPIGSYIVHNVRGEHDFQRHWLPPPTPETNVGERLASSRLLAVTNHPRNRQRRKVRWGRRPVRAYNELDELERAIERRRHIYRHNLFAKVRVCNSLTPRPWRLYSQDYFDLACCFQPSYTIQTIP